MHDTFVLFEKNGVSECGKRIYLGEKGGKDECWMRDKIFQNPEIIPVVDLDPTFGELIPLCTELRTDVGSVDAVFINKDGRLTIVECKLWNNPEARRKVVAQALDYVSAISEWKYADLQRQVSIATQKQGNVPFETVRNHFGDEVIEREFVDAVSRSLREGRFLVLIAGDGIREGVQSLTDLVSRNATKAFSFGLLEVATYELTDGRLLIQPRVLLKTELIERQFVTLDSKDGAGLLKEQTESQDDSVEGPKRKGSRLDFKKWWAPILQMKFDDPEQEAPYWSGSNNAVLRTPYPGVFIKAWSGTDGATGVFLSSNQSSVPAESVSRFIKFHKDALTKELPEGTEVDEDSEHPLLVRNDDLETDDEKYNWIKKNLNVFVNVLRPKLLKWHKDQDA
jgi:hypothetical protein